ncbi:RES family NAD+ phosphorylase [Salinarimonas rosea]|uniref:RES family NAD+ phosphorylase n=1 Tax=Salinarimonas rosea TaxID=552063 RepID=UPI00040517BA|nr:RES family NAD+ phosphorylase [Salinarimonas rosea]
MAPPGELRARIAARATRSLECIVHRITRPSAHPLLPSTSGGRWAPASEPGAPSVPVLYTSFEPDGALAEVASYLALLSPPPGKPLAAHRIAVALARVVRLDEDTLHEVGVDRAAFHARHYQRTQEVGAEVAALGYEGLIVPSARWTCDNLVIFTANLSPESRLAVEATDVVDWQAFARRQGLL